MRSRIFLSILILTIFFCARAAALPTEEGPGPSRVVEIDSIVVTGRYVKEIVPAQVLSGRQLQRLNSHTVSDALRYFSGLQIKDYGGIGGLKTVNIRSMGSHHVGVFYDGIQIGNAQNGTVDLGKFSLDNMELVSLYNGQKSDIFQSARDFASSGAVYMVTRRPAFEGDKNDNLNFKIKAGSFDLIDGSALWEHRFSDRLSLSMNVEALNTSGKYKFRYSKKEGYDTTEVRRNGDVVFLRAETALFGKIERGEWQAKGYFYNSNRGYPGAAVKKDYAISLLNEDRQRDRNFFFQGSLRRQFSSFYSYKLSGKYANDFMNYVMPPETTTLQPMDIEYRQQEFYLTVANLFALTDRWTANLSADFQWNSLEAGGTEMFDTNFPRPRRYTVLGAAATSVNLGRVTAQGSVLYTFVHDVSARKMATAGDKNIFSPTVIASYTPFQNIDLDIRAFYKQIFRMPTFNDLYYVQLGNRLLKPEYTTQYNIGVACGKRFDRGFITSVDASVDAYYNEVKDKIVAVPTANQGMWTMLNYGYVEIRGVDATANAGFNIGKIQFTARLAYTYQKAQDFTPEKREDEFEHVLSPYGDQIPYIPWHSGSLVVNASYGQWDLNYSFIYTGERYTTGNNVAKDYIQPWYTHDMSVARNIAFGRSRLRVTAEVNNIFNQRYEVVRWYPMPGTNFKIILSLTL